MITIFLSVTCYNVTMLTNNYYNDFFELGQQKINFSFFELSLPDDDPVYTLKKVMEELDFSGLLANCSDKGRTGYNPIMMYAVVTYANMRGIRAVDRIVELCERDLALKLQKNLEQIAEKEQIGFVYGKGKRKPEIQQLDEELEVCGERLMGYKECFEIMGKNRNSYSKTDLEATFMRMKEDHISPVFEEK